MAIHFFFNKPEKKEGTPPLRNRADFDSFASYIFTNAKFTDFTVKELAAQVRKASDPICLQEITRSMEKYTTKEDAELAVKGQAPQYWLNDNLFYRLACLMWLDDNGYGNLVLNE